MKRTIAFILIAAMVFALIPSIALADSELVSVTVKTNPTKMQYAVGESFDPTGLVVTGKFKDSSTKDYSFDSNEVSYDSYKYKTNPENKAITIRLTVGDITKTVTVATSCNSGSAVKMQSLGVEPAKMTLSVSTSDSISPTVYPSNAENITFSYVSGDTNIAKVSADTGIVTGVAAGETFIKVTATQSNPSCTRDATVYVKVEAPKAVTNVSLSPRKFELLLGDKTTLECTVTPEAAKEEIKWSSSDPDVCSVSSSGQLKGLKVGTALITATCNGVSASTEINVKKTLSTKGSCTIINCRRGVNVRKSPSGTSAAIGTAYAGRTYYISDQSGSWYKITLDSSHIGWVYKTYVSTDATGKKYKVDTDDSSSSSESTTTTTTTTSAKVKIVNCTRRVYVKESASSSAHTIGYATLASTYPVKGKTSDGAWYVIDYNGKVGYVQSKFCSLK